MEFPWPPVVSATSEKQAYQSTSPAGEASGVMVPTHLQEAISLQTFGRCVALRSMPDRTGDAIVPPCKRRTKAPQYVGRRVGM